MVSMVFALMFPKLIGRLVDAALPSVKLVADGWQPPLNTVALLLVGTLAMQAILTFFSSSTFNGVGQRAVTALRLRLYQRRR